jgi:hypothetical protein
MASGLLPFLHDAGCQEPGTAKAALQSLQAGLDRIGLAVRRLTEDQGDEPAATNDVHVEPVREPAKAIPIVEIERPAVPQPLPPIIVNLPVPLLQALRDLQEARARSLQPTRDVLEAVIQRAEKEADHLDVARVGRILGELNALDDAFVQEVHRRVPIISSTLARIRSSGAKDFVTASQLDPIFEQVEALYDLADRVQATTITMFLQGLRAFLMVSAYRKTSTLAQRLGAVESRIHALIPMAEQWSNIGRVERSAISEILPR